MHLDIRVEDLQTAIDFGTSLGGSGPLHVYGYDEGTVAEMADREGNEFGLVAVRPGATLA